MQDDIKNQNAGIQDSRGTDSGCVDCGLVGVDSSRRNFNKLGLATPVLASLVSSPVIAGNCFSNILSGNLSDPSKGSCQMGYNSAAWCNCTGSISIYSTLTAWDMATGITNSYSGQATNCSANSGARITDINLIKNYFASSQQNTRLKAIVCGSSSSARTLVTAFLNAGLSDASGSNFNYVLTLQQLANLLAAPSTAPGGNLLTFLEWTWVSQGSSSYIFP